MTLKFLKGTSGAPERGAPARRGALLTALLVGALGAMAAAPANAAVVINEVYGGGGNSGSVYKNDFIELYNNGTAAVDLTGYTLQYASATGATFSTTPPTGTNTPVFTALSGTIQPGGYFLVQEAAGAAGTTALPTPDVVGGIAIAATAGKVALANDGNAVTFTAPSTFSSNVIDFVGFGTTANAYEGSGPAVAPSNTTSVSRSAGVDSNDNKADFGATATTPSPTGSGAAPAPTSTPVPTATPNPGATATPVPTPTTVPTATPTAAPTPVGTIAPPTTTSTLVISEVYGGGGNTGATYTNDFIELYNGGTSAVDLSTYSVAYASQNGTTFASTSLSGVLAPGSFYLVQEASGGAVGAALPTPNATGTINLSATVGRVALVNVVNNTLTTVDFVGFGAVTQFEGTGTSAAPSGSNTTSVSRTSPFIDTNQNSTDFSAKAPSPGTAGAVSPVATTGAIINEFRASGPGGAADDFVEIYNQNNTPLNVTGWTLTNGGTLIGTVSTTTVIPAYARLLFTGSGYSLTSYASSDFALSGDVTSSGPLSLLNASGTTVDTVNSASLPAPTSLSSNYSFVRRMDGTGGAPQDTGSDSSDFNTVDVASTVGPDNLSGATSGVLRLGAPGPQNLASPIVANQFITFTFANQVRSGSGNSGTLALRYTVANPAGSGRTITALRFRATALTAGTAATPANQNPSGGAFSGPADVRLVSSSASGAILPLILETPPAQPNGGGLNSSVSLSGLPAGGIAAGSSVTVEFLFNVVQRGNYKFLLNLEPVTTTP